MECKFSGHCCLWTPSGHFWKKPAKSSTGAKSNLMNSSPSHLLSLVSQSTTMNLSQVPLFRCPEEREFKREKLPRNELVNQRSETRTGIQLGRLRSIKAHGFDHLSLEIRQLTIAQNSKTRENSCLPIANVCWLRVWDMGEGLDLEEEFH